MSKFIIWLLQMFTHGLFVYLKYIWKYLNNGWIPKPAHKTIFKPLSSYAFAMKDRRQCHWSARNKTEWKKFLLIWFYFEIISNLNKCFKNSTKNPTQVGIELKMLVAPIMSCIVKRPSPRSPVACSYVSHLLKSGVSIFP